MHMKKRAKFKPIFKQWLYSYILIAFIPVVLCCGVYASCEKILMSQLENQNKYIMGTVQKNSIKTLANIKNIALTMRNDIRMERVVNIESLDYYWGNSDVYEIMHEIQNYARYTIGSYSKLYIYLRNNDIVLSENGIMRSKEFYNIMFNGKNISYEKWMNTLDERTKIRFIPVTYYDRDTELEYDGLEYLVPASDGAAVISIIINENVIFEDIHNSEWGEACNAYLFSAGGRKLLSCVRVGSDVEKLDELVPRKGVVHLTQGVSVESTKWTIVTEVDKNQILRSRYLFRKTFSIFILISLVVIYFVITRLLKKNYAPVNSLVKIINVDTGNEFEALKASIQDLLFRNGMLVEKSEIQAVKLHKLLLEKIIAGTSEEGFLLNGQMGMVDILFEHPCFCIAIFDIEANDLFGSDKQMRAKERNKLFNISIGNIVSETCAMARITGEFLEISGYNLCVINYNEWDEKTICGVLGQILKKAYDIFGIKVFYSKSKKAAAIESLTECYRQARELDEYKKILSYKGNVSYDRYEESLNNKVLFTENDEKLLQNLLEFNNCHLIKDTINALFAGVTFLNGASFTDIEKFLSKIVNIVREGIDEKSEQLETADKERIKKLLAVENVDRTHDNLLLAIDILFNEHQSGNTKNIMIKEIIKYVEENYADRNLSVSMISREFHLGTSYIIKIFKENTSMTLLEYIADYRIRKAIELMERTSYSNQEICDMVGFNHIKTFNRTFKKIIGVSPAGYKNAEIKKEEK